MAKRRCSFCSFGPKYLVGHHRSGSAHSDDMARNRIFNIWTLDVSRSRSPVISPAVAGSRPGSEGLAEHSSAQSASSRFLR